MPLPFDSDTSQWLLGFIGALMISSLAWHIRALSADGIIAAMIVGTVVVGAAGWWAGAILIAFFVSSSILSRIGRDFTTVSTPRGNRRDAAQVLANGGIALLAATGWAITRHPAWLLALAGSLAAANADTWSTEIGRTSHSLPRLITTGQQVAAGTSGAVSGRGLIGAAGGALLLGALTTAGGQAGWIAIAHSPSFTLLAVTIAGVFGSLFDSLLGATIQEQRWCDVCDRHTERKLHHCGTRTRHIRGFSWMTNDVVNILSVTSGAALASAFAF